MVLKSPNRIRSYLIKKDFTAPVIVGYKDNEIEAPPIVHDGEPGVYLGKFISFEKLAYVKTA